MEIRWCGKLVPQFHPPSINSYRIHPLQTCINTSSKDYFAWNESCAQAFTAIKQILCEITEQSVFDANHKTFLWTDASDYGIGSVLIQQDPKNGKWNPVYFYSRALHGPELRYDVRDKELLSVVMSLKSMHHLLRGVPFQLLTDHRSLQHLRTTKMHSSQRHIRWLDFIQSFDMTPVYIPGETNCVADLLSRRPTWLRHFESSLRKWEERWADQGVQVSSTSIKHNSVSTYRTSHTCAKLTVSTAHTPNSNPPMPASLPSALSALPLPSISANSTFSFQAANIIAELIPSELLDSILSSQSQYLHGDGQSLVRTPAQQIIIPDGDVTLARRVVSELHSAFHHLGRHKTLLRVKRLFHIKHLQRICAEVCRACQICQQVKVPRAPPFGVVKPLNTDDSHSVFHTISLDFVWGLPTHQGRSGFLTIVDGYSKHVSAYPMRPNCSSQSVAQCLRQHASIFGLPARVRADQDRKFTAASLQEFLKGSGIRTKFSSVYHPNANGLVERVQQTLVQMLRASILSSNAPWTEILPLC